MHKGAAYKLTFYAHRADPYGSNCKPVIDKAVHSIGLGLSSLLNRAWCFRSHNGATLSMKAADARGKDRRRVPLKSRVSSW